MFGKDGASVGQQLLHSFALATSGLESAPLYKTAWDENVGEIGCKTQQDGGGGDCHHGIVFSAIYNNKYD